jgi:hypothetical protein
MMKTKRGEGGVSLLLWFFIEVVIAFTAIILVFTLVNSMVDRATYFQQLHAKDNAYMIEALHAAPNGQVDTAYIWSGSSFLVTFEPNQVVVARAADNGQEGSAITKAFGTSQETPLTPTTAFIPQNYLFTRRDGEQSSILIDQRFANARCPTAYRTITGIQAAGEEKGFPGGTADQFAQDTVQRVRLTKQELSESGISFYIVYEQGVPVETAVYYNADDTDRRFACTISRALRGADTSTTYAPLSATQHAELATRTENVIIYTRVETLEDATDITKHIQEGILAYWEAEQ